MIKEMFIVDRKTPLRWLMQWLTAKGELENRSELSASPSARTRFDFGYLQVFNRARDYAHVCSAIDEAPRTRYRLSI